VNRLALSDETGELSIKNVADPRIRYPLYKAFVAPDIYFIGFDLTLDEVKGDPTLDETAMARAKLKASDLGWFFVLQEIVGDPRFGLDVKEPTEKPPPESWSGLSWVNVDFPPGQSVVDVLKPLLKTSNTPREDGTKWGANASDMAYILYQQPVMVGIHGREMLKNLVVPV
jgi:hypothetical protein